MERGTQKPGESRESRVLQDSLTPEALQQLQQILADLSLQTSPPEQKGYSTVILDGDFTTVWLSGSNGGANTPVQEI